MPDVAAPRTLFSGSSPTLGRHCHVPTPPRSKARTPQTEAITAANACGSPLLWLFAGPTDGTAFG